MTKFGRPKEKDASSKITLYLEDTVIEQLNHLAAANKTSRSRIIEILVRERAGEPSEIGSTQTIAGRTPGKRTPPPPLPDSDLEKVVQVAEDLADKELKRRSSKRK